MIAALIIALITAFVVGLAFRVFAPEYSAPAAALTFLLVLLYRLGFSI